MYREAFQDLKERKKIWDFWGLDSEVMLVVPYEVYVNIKTVWRQIGQQLFDFDCIFIDPYSAEGPYTRKWQKLRGFYHTLSQVGITVGKHLLFEPIVYFFAVCTPRRNWELLSHEMIETTSQENFSEMKKMIKDQKLPIPVDKWEEQLFTPVYDIFTQKLSHFGLLYFFNEIPDGYKEEYRFLVKTMRYITQHHLWVSKEKWNRLTIDQKIDTLDYKWRIKDKEERIKLYNLPPSPEETECEESPKEETLEEAPTFTGEIQSNTTTKPKKKK